MTLAALEATLRLYLNPDEALRKIPTLRMLSEPADAVRSRAELLAEEVRRRLPEGCAEVAVVPETARAGGGALPLCDIDTHAAQISFLRGSAQDCERFLVTCREVPVVGRIKKERLLLDARTLAEAEAVEAAEAVGAYFAAREDAGRSAS